MRPIVGADVTLAGAPPLLLLVENRRGYRNLCRLLTAARAGLRQARSAARDAGAARRARRRADRARRRRPARRSPRARGGVRARQRLPRDRAPPPTATAAGANAPPSRRRPRPASASSPPTTSATRRRASASCTTSLTCARAKPTVDDIGRRLAPNGERWLKSPRAMAALFRDRPAAVRATRDDRRALRGSRSPISATRSRAIRSPTARPSRATSKRSLARRRRPLRRRRSDPAQGPPPADARAGDHRPAGAGRLLPGGLGHRPVREAARHHDPGTRLGGELDLLLRAGHHRGRSGADGSAVRALPVRGAGGERRQRRRSHARHRSRSAVRRRARAVIQHVYAKYGARGAAMTANVITYRPRLAVRDAGRALGFSEEQLDASARTCRAGSTTKAARSPSTSRWRGSRARERRTRLAARVATELLNLPRHLGQHSGGMVIAAGRLDEVVPLEPASMPGRVVVQWDKDDCADLGIVKVDLLGLGMMAVLADAVPLIRRHEGIDVDYARLPPDDPKVYAHAARRRHRRRVPGRVAGPDGDAAAHEAGAVLRSGRRGGDHPARADRRQDGEPVPRTAQRPASRSATRTRRWSRSWRARWACRCFRSS